MSAVPGKAIQVTARECGLFGFFLREENVSPYKIRPKNKNDLYEVSIFLVDINDLRVICLDFHSQ